MSGVTTAGAISAAAALTVAAALFATDLAGRVPPEAAAGVEPVA
jgi:hypothetical protein